MARVLARRSRLGLALQLQADWLQQRAHSHEGQSGYRFDIDSWTVGVMLIWYP